MVVGFGKPLENYLDRCSPEHWMPDYRTHDSCRHCDDGFCKYHELQVDDEKIQTLITDMGNLICRNHEQKDN